ncbi:MAG: LacI family DNA-binding transcriptional regulator [Alphaproteobacteria bacterium]
MVGSTTKIRDVARLAGVSTATVSRAIHNPGVVTKETRAKVDRAVRETGYAGNAMARNLRRMETRMIVVLVPDIGNIFFSELLSAIEMRAAESGYSILIGDTTSDPGRARVFADFVRGFQADGMILLDGKPPHFATPAGAAQGQGVAANQPPVVVLSERLPGFGYPTVCIDNTAAARGATAFLINQGHRRIAHITGPSDNILTGERRQGYRDAMAAAGLPQPPEYEAGGEFTIGSGRRAVDRLLALKQPPTAIFCSSDDMAMGAIAGIKAAGLSVPGDISLVGFDDIQLAAWYDPPITTVRQPRRAIGETGMAIMADILAGKVVAGGDRVLPTELIPRASTGPAPAAGPAPATGPTTGPVH